MAATSPAPEPSSPSPPNPPANRASLLQYHYSKLANPLHLNNREPQFRNLVIRFMFTEMEIAKLPYPAENDAKLPPRGPRALRGTLGEPNSRETFSRQAAGLFMERYGMRIWKTKVLGGSSWEALRLYLETVAAMEIVDKVWGDFWQGPDVKKHEVNGIEEEQEDEFVVEWPRWARIGSAMGRMVRRSV